MPNSIIISTGEFYHLSAGESLAGATVESGGLLLVYSGAYASLITVETGGAEYVQQGGSGIQNIPTQYVISGQGDYNIPVHFATELDILASGSAYSSLVGSGAFLDVNDGGVAGDTKVSNGGYVETFAGGIENDTVADIGGFDVVNAGGSAIDTSAFARSIQYVESGGSAFGTLVETDGTQAISGGKAYGTSVGLSGSEVIYSGGLAVGTQVTSGGLESVDASGTAELTTIANSGIENVFTSGVTSGTIVSSGGRQFLKTPGATSFDTTVESSGFAFVGTDTTASGTVVASDGTDVVEAGGSAVGTILTSGGTLDLPDFVFSGGSAFLDEQTDVLTITQGSVTSQLTLASDYSGEGFVAGQDAGSGTMITLSSLVIPAGSSSTVVGGVVSFAVVEGVQAVIDAGSTVSTTVSSGGASLISAGGHAYTTILKFGGRQIVASAGAIFGTLVSSGGAAFVSSGGLANATIVNRGGAAYVSASGSATSTTLSGGFDAVVGGTASSTNVMSGATEFTGAAGLTTGTTIRKLGDAYVSGSGTISGAAVNGGFDAVYGGSANGTSVGSGGAEYVGYGGSASGTQVGSNGIQYVYAGGSANDTVVGSGGQEVVSSGGTVIGTVLSGGHETVYAGGVASNTVVVGGAEYVLSDGVARGTTLDSGATQTVYSGGVLEGTSVGAGGAIDLTYLPFAAGATAVLASATDILTVTEAGVPVTVELLGSYANDTFQVASDGGAGTLITVNAAETPGALADVAHRADTAPVTTFTANDEADLIAALKAVDRTGSASSPNTAYTINFGAGISLAAGQDLPAIDLDSGDSLTIEGNGNTLNANDATRGLFDYQGAVAIDDLTIANAVATGGSGGGGGAGLGGGLFVAAAGSVTLSGVSFIADAAVGGAGGTSLGGGGLGGNGALGGGGIGQTATGGGVHGGDGGGGIAVAVAPGGGGISGLAGEAEGDDGGGGGDEGGGGGGNAGGGDGGGDGGDGGGGANAASRGVSLNGLGAALANVSFTGGAGGFGGGGGGDVNPNGRGAAGGFGGGGGSDVAAGGVGGVGGFGGGGGNGAAGGMGGGSGGATGGGGGLGAGGAVFVQAGGSLTMATGTLAADLAGGGTGAGGGGTGGLAGAGLFLDGNQTVDLDPAQSQTLTIANDIADDTALGGTGAGSMLLTGQGTVVLDATNSFAGGTTIAAGTLEIGTDGSDGAGNVTLGPSGTTLKIDDGGKVNAIRGFNPGNTLDLADLPAAYANPTLTFDQTTQVLNVADAQGFAFQYTIDGNYAPDGFASTDAANGDVLITLACFAAGTRIATEHGDVPVEKLRPSDRIKLATGGLAPVVWLGHRRVMCRRHPCPADVQPVRIAAHAFGLGRPGRDLLVSPDHALWLEGVLIPARYLLNGATVRQEDVTAVTYWHVELPTHGVLLAEGLPAESFLDTGNRSAFTNGGRVVSAHPHFARSVWARQGCAPLVTEGPARDLVYRQLLAQAFALGWHTTDAGGGASNWVAPAARVAAGWGTRTRRVVPETAVPVTCVRGRIARVD